MVRYSVVFLVLNHVILLTRALPYEKQEYSNIDVAREKRENPPKKGGCDSGIVFPDKSKNEECNAKFIATGKGRNCIAGICEDAEDYPYEQVNKTLGKLAVYSNLFGFNEGARIDLNSKGTGAETENLCSITIVTKYPKTLHNENKVEKFIVNVEGHKQGVIFEMCTSENGKCRFADLFPTGFTSECVQKYVTRRLMAMGEDGNPAFDSFVVPSCCVCSTKLVN